MSEPVPVPDPPSGPEPTRFEVTVTADAEVTPGDPEE